MRLLSGPISVRLRALFGPAVADWPAYREPEEIHDMPAQNYTGVAMGARWPIEQEETNMTYSNEPSFPVPGPQAPYVPGLRTRAQRRMDTGGFATTEGPAPKPAVPDDEDKLVVWERALDLIKNVVVVVTCLVILYSVWTVYRALGELAVRLEQLPL